MTTTSTAEGGSTSPMPDTRLRRLVAATAAAQRRTSGALARTSRPQGRLGLTRAELERTAALLDVRGRATMSTARLKRAINRTR